VQVPTSGGSVQLKVPSGTRARPAAASRGAGAAETASGEGDLFAIVQIAVPSAASERERALYGELAGISTFNPRGHFAQEA